MNHSICRIFTCSVLFTVPAHSMDLMTKIVENVGQATVESFNYAHRHLNPQSYAVNPSNRSWTDTLAQQTNEQSPSNLSEYTACQDGKEHAYSYDMTKRSVDKISALLHTIVPLCLQKNLSPQDLQSLDQLLNTNQWLIPDLHYLLVTRTLELNKKIDVTHSGDAYVDVVLQKMDALSQAQRIIFFKWFLRAKNGAPSQVQLNNYCLALPESQWQEFVTSINRQRGSAPENNTY